MSATPLGAEQTSRHRRIDPHVDRVRLVANGTCAHVLCWRVACRRCDATLLPHEGPAGMRLAVVEAVRTHACAAEGS